MATELTTTDERVLAKLGELAERFSDLESQMNDPAMASNRIEMIKFAKEHGRLSGLVSRYRRYQEILRQREEAEVLAEDESTEVEMRELAERRLADINSNIIPLGE